MTTADTKAAAEAGRAAKEEKVVRTLRITPALDARVDEASEKIGLGKSDTMRMALERGLGILTAQLAVADGGEAPAA